MSGARNAQIGTVGAGKIADPVAPSSVYFLLSQIIHQMRRLRPAARNQVACNRITEGHRSMVTTLPVIYSRNAVELPGGIVSEARERAERLARNIFALNSLAAATVVVFLALGLLPFYDKSFVAYLTLFVTGLTCATLALMRGLSGGTDGSAQGRAKPLARLRRSFGNAGAFWLLFFGLFCFVSGTACALVALSTAPGDSVAMVQPAAGAAQPALTGAAVGYWEEELASALLAGDQPRFLRSCDRLDDLLMRPEICDLSARRHGG
jgi:hypothetical protein